MVREHARELTTGRVSLLPRQLARLAFSLVFIPQTVFASNGMVGYSQVLNFLLVAVPIGILMLACGSMAIALRWGGSLGRAASGFNVFVSAVIAIVGLAHHIGIFDVRNDVPILIVLYGSPCALLAVAIVLFAQLISWFNLRFRSGMEAMWGPDLARSPQFKFVGIAIVLLIVAVRYFYLGLQM